MGSTCTVFSPKLQGLFKASVHFCGLQLITCMRSTQGLGLILQNTQIHDVRVFDRVYRHIKKCWYLMNDNERLNKSEDSSDK